MAFISISASLQRACNSNHVTKKQQPHQPRAAKSSGAKHTTGNISYIILVFRERERTCLRSSIFVGFKSILMHDPVRLLTIRGSAFIKNQSLSHPNQAMPSIYGLVSSCCFPETCLRCSICACSRLVFLIFVAKNVPFISLFTSYFTQFCIYTISIYLYIYIF